jgi:hypothetical protein
MAFTSLIGQPNSRLANETLGVNQTTVFATLAAIMARLAPQATGAVSVTKASNEASLRGSFGSTAAAQIAAFIAKISASKTTKANYTEAASARLSSIGTTTSVAVIKAAMSGGSHALTGSLVSAVRSASTALASASKAAKALLVVASSTAVGTTSRTNLIALQIAAAAKQAAGQINGIGIALGAIAARTLAATVSVTVQTFAVLGTAFTSLLGDVKSRLANEVLGQNQSITRFFTVGSAPTLPSTSNTKAVTTGIASKERAWAANAAPTGVLSTAAKAIINTAVSRATALLAIGAASRKSAGSDAWMTIGNIVASISAVARLGVGRILVGVRTSTSATQRLLQGSVALRAGLITSASAAIRPVAILMAFIGEAAKAQTGTVDSARKAILATAARGKTQSAAKTLSVKSTVVAATKASAGILNGAIRMFAIGRTAQQQPTAIPVIGRAIAALSNSGSAATHAINQGVALLHTAARSGLGQLQQLGRAVAAATQAASVASSGNTGFAGRQVAIRAFGAVWKALIHFVRIGAVAVRTFEALYQQRLWIIDSEEMLITVKDPGAMEDFAFDWTPVLGTADLINASAWTVPPGLTMGTETFSDTSATVRLSGGSVNGVYDVFNTVTLASGQVKVRHLLITVQEV